LPPTPTSKHVQPRASSEAPFALPRSIAVLDLWRATCPILGRNIWCTSLRANVLRLSGAMHNISLACASLLSAHRRALPFEHRSLLKTVECSSVRASPPPRQCKPLPCKLCIAVSYSRPSYHSLFGKSTRSAGYASGGMQAAGCTLAFRALRCPPSCCPPFCSRLRCLSTGPYCSSALLLFRLAPCSRDALPPCSLLLHCFTLRSALPPYSLALLCALLCYLASLRSLQLAPSFLLVYSAVLTHLLTFTF
jgi:hypothetical protein